MLRILKFWPRIWKLDRKLGYRPSKVWGVQDAPLRTYKRLKNEISTGYNTKIFNTLQKFYYRGSTCSNIFTYPDSTCQALALTSRPINWKNLNFFLISFILANFEILTSDLETRPKIRVLPKNFNNFKNLKNLLILRILKFWPRIWKLDRKLGYWPS